MSLWESFTSKNGFDDGADEMMIHRLIRDRTVELLNEAIMPASEYVFAGYDRPGMHNSCMIIGGIQSCLTRPPLDETTAWPFTEGNTELRGWPEEVSLDKDLLERLEDIGHTPSMVNSNTFCEAVAKLASTYVNHEMYEALLAVREIRKELWVNDDPEDTSPKEWSPDTPANIATIMASRGFGNPTGGDKP